MKKFALLLAATMTTAILGMACGGGGGGGGATPTPTPGAVSNGTYTVTNAGLSTNGCGFTSSFWEDFTTAEITSTPNSITVGLGGGSLTYQVTGTDLIDSGSPGAFTVDCNDVDANGDPRCGTANLYDCVLAADITYGGQITGTDQFQLVDSYDLDEDSGLECAAVATSAYGGVFPCTTLDSADFAL